MQMLFYRWVWLTSFCLVCFSAKSQQENPVPQNILPYPIHSTVLKNGLQVVCIPYDSPGLVSFQIIMRVGSRDETESGKTGFAHFFEHMMFRGTKKYSKEAYDKVLKSVGASANANTWLDRTVYHMTGNAAMLETMFELESDRFMNLAYSEQDFKTEAGAVKGEYTKNFSSPFRRLDEKMNEVAFTKHTYSHTTMGYFKDIVDMPKQFDYSLKFFDRFYRPEYATLLVVGDAKPEEVTKLAEKYFGNWEHGKFSSKIPMEPEQEKIRFAHVAMEGVPPVLMFNYKTPSFNDKPEDVIALDVLMAVLFSEKSNIHKKLVITEQKARSLSSEVLFTRDPYVLSIEAVLKNKDQMFDVEYEIRKAIEKAAEDGVENNLLQEVKKRIRYSFSMGMNSPDAIANSMAYFIWVSADPQALNKAYALYEKVTLADLKRVAQTYLKPSKLTLSTVSPDSKSPFEK